MIPDFTKVAKDDLFTSRGWLLTEAMATCHAITYVNNELIGDPLEIKMFEST